MEKLIDALGLVRVSRRLNFERLGYRLVMLIWAEILDQKVVHNLS